MTRSIQRYLVIVMTAAALVAGCNDAMKSSKVTISRGNGSGGGVDAEQLHGEFSEGGKCLNLEKVMAAVNSHKDKKLFVYTHEATPVTGEFGNQSTVEDARVQLQVVKARPADKILAKATTGGALLSDPDLARVFNFHQQDCSTVTVWDETNRGAPVYTFEVKDKSSRLYMAAAAMNPAQVALLDEDTDIMRVATHVVAPSRPGTPPPAVPPHRNNQPLPPAAGVRKPPEKAVPTFHDIILSETRTGEIWVVNQSPQQVQITRHVPTTMIDCGSPKSLWVRYTYKVDFLSKNKDGKAEIPANVLISPVLAQNLVSLRAVTDKQFVDTLQAKVATAQDAKAKPALRDQALATEIYVNAINAVKTDDKIGDLICKMDQPAGGK